MADSASARPDVGAAPVVTIEGLDPDGALLTEVRSLEHDLRAISPTLRQIADRANETLCRIYATEDAAVESLLASIPGQEQSDLDDLDDAAHQIVFALMGATRLTDMLLEASTMLDPDRIYSTYTNGRARDVSASTSATGHEE